jgi:hypothetical protein
VTDVVLDLDPGAPHPALARRGWWQYVIAGDVSVTLFGTGASAPSN